MCPIAWVDGAPLSHGEPEVPFFNASRQRATVLVLGEVQKCITHFSGMTVPCLGVECTHCRNSVATKVSVFVGALRYLGKDGEGRPDWQKVIWNFYDNIFRYLGDPPFRGIHFDTWKVESSAGQKILIERSPKAAIELNVPAIDVKRLLYKKWRIPEPKSDPIRVYDGGDLPEARGGAA